MFAATLVLTLLGLVLGLLLGLAAKVFAVGDENPLVKEVEGILAGSQCGQCGFPGCGPAAVAIVEGTAPITCCPPGGKSVVEALAKCLDIDLSTLGEAAVPLVARIEKALCVGCTRCFKVCPTNAIIGANKQLHVVMEKACIGCTKCAQECPENCIDMIPEEATLTTWHWPKPQLEPLPLAASA
jgi:Na+-translocating ferredoxin:NAD+ oxidoreductase subunit B